MYPNSVGRFGGALACCVALFCGELGALAQAPDAELDVAQIANGIEETESLLFGSESFYIECAWVSSENFAQTKYGHLLAGFSFSFGRRGGNWYAKIVDANPLEPGAPASTTRTVVYRDQVSANLHQGLVFVSPEIDGALLAYWDYFDNVSMNVYKQLVVEKDELAKVPEAQKPFLPAELRAHGKEYRVLPKQEKIDGFWCHVVARPSLDRFWCDAEHGFAMRRREYHYGREYNYNHPAKPLHRVILNRDYQEAKKGLWLPTTQIVDLYADPRTEERRYWGKRTNRRVLKVSTLRFDSVTDDLFKVEIPPGWLVYDNVRQMKYRVPRSGARPFEDAIEAAQSMNRYSTWQIILLAHGVIGGLLVAYLLLRRIRSIRPHAGGP